MENTARDGLTICYIQKKKISTMHFMAAKQNEVCIFHSTKMLPLQQLRDKAKLSQ